MKKKILLLDDEDLIIKSFEKLLSKKGYEVIVVDNGLAAVEIAENKEFDLIISDIRMPWLNGIETVQELIDTFRSKQLQPPPIIFITGYADQTCEEQAKALDPVAYLNKPVDIQEFLEVVQKALEDNKLTKKDL